ncbi:ankyrin repeat and zinc finger domain-containing protein [Striga asiatica]|uniref:Ankyrin repeat and zinc finger domain-containing protein n=1 Tax=Striga asiatica TaxID=4170 RepID=A0A5A7RK19_STRAF|nr:ankyrin repeat and zinc finger domain-containing protein [Striga asiatica]
MATDAENKPEKSLPRRQIKEDDTKRHRSVFEVPPDFFNSCRLLHSPFSAPPDSAAYDLEEPKPEKKVSLSSSRNNISGTDAQALQKWSCNTCKAEFESLQDQRFHFKSDLHRFNIKLSVAGKSTIKEEDFDGAASDSLCKDYDVSSISGSDDEDEREIGLLSDRQREFGGFLKSKILIELQNGERVSIWKCLLLDESENISFEDDKSVSTDRAGVTHLTQKEVSEKLKYVLREPRDGTCVRIVLLARGGHFAGCVFDGNSLLAHKTFHRYVVRAKAGKKQSSKDAGGRSIHSAGASLRRYNELGLKKDIQELLASWKSHFIAASCVFIYAPSNNRQLFFDGDNKPHFACQHRAIRNIPMTVRRPTFKEAKRIYGLLIQISPEIKHEMSSNSNEGTKVSKLESGENSEGTKISESCSLVNEIDGLTLSAESKKNDAFGTSTPLHEAAKSGDSEKVLELLEEGLDPCVKDERDQTPYMLANDKEVRNTFRRFMALNLERWDWHAAKVPSALTKEMEESQAAKQAEKDAKRKAKAKELKKLKKAKEKKAQVDATQSPNDTGIAASASVSSCEGHSSAVASKEVEQRRIQEEREKRAAAAERRMAALAASRTQETASSSSMTNNNDNNINNVGDDMSCSCCNVSLAGKVPYHRYQYKYCSTSCMFVHKDLLDEG